MNGGLEEGPRFEGPDDVLGHSFQDVQPGGPTTHAAWEVIEKRGRGVSPSARSEASALAEHARLLGTDPQLGRYFRKLREDASLSRENVGIMLNIPAPVIAKVEDDPWAETAIAPERLARWAVAIGALKRLTVALVRERPSVVGLGAPGLPVRIHGTKTHHAIGGIPLEEDLPAPPEAERYLTTFARAFDDLSAAP